MLTALALTLPALSAAALITTAHKTDLQAAAHDFSLVSDRDDPAATEDASSDSTDDPAKLVAAAEQQNASDGDDPPTATASVTAAPAASAAATTDVDPADLKADPAAAVHEDGDHANLDPASAHLEAAVAAEKAATAADTSAAAPEDGDPASTMEADEEQLKADASTAATAVPATSAAAPEDVDTANLDADAAQFAADNHAATAVSDGEDSNVNFAATKGETLEAAAEKDSIADRLAAEAREQAQRQVDEENMIEGLRERASGNCETACGDGGNKVDGPCEPECEGVMRQCFPNAGEERVDKGKDVEATILDCMKEVAEKYSKFQAHWDDAGDDEEEPMVDEDKLQSLHAKAKDRCSKAYPPSEDLDTLAKCEVKMNNCVTTYNDDASVDGCMDKVAAEIQKSQQAPQADSLLFVKRIRGTARE